jgi:hypothetical protein
MDSEIFRILTFSEFKILIGGIFALSPTPMNTLAQLIKSINSDMTSPQKFSKVIKLIELLLEEENFFFRMASSFSDQG